MTKLSPTNTLPAPISSRLGSCPAGDMSYHSIDELEGVGLPSISQDRWRISPLFTPCTAVMSSGTATICFGGPMTTHDTRSAQQPSFPLNYLGNHSETMIKANDNTYHRNFPRS
jgi:hypothetical protein